MFRKIANRLMSRETPRARRAVAAFGKHPGWNDHIDDLGLDTELLVLIKRLLYVEGIAGNIDSGAWERLAPDQRLEGFDHVLVVRGGTDLAIGRIWSSRDGKGRSKYPMVVCADCSGMNAAAALSGALPILESLKQHCERAEAQAGVIAALDEARAALTSWAAPTDPGITAEGAVRRFSESPDMGERGLVRVLYQIERELASYVRGAHRASRSMVLAPHHLRVPACAPAPGAALEAWAAFFAAQLDDMTPLMLLAPVGRGWVDAIVGSPTPAQFHCIRATEKAVPLTTEIPYNIDVEFVTRARKLIGT